MQIVEYQRSMESHTTAIGAHETTFHCIGDVIHVIYSRVVDTEYGIEIKTTHGKWVPIHLWDYRFISDTEVDRNDITRIIDDMESKSIVYYATLKPARRYTQNHIATPSVRTN